MNISRVIVIVPTISSSPSIIIVSIIVSLQLVIDTASYLEEVRVFVFSLIKHIKVEERHQESCHIKDWDQILGCRLELSCKPRLVSANKD